jgi:hypothetical protein
LRRNRDEIRGDGHLRLGPSGIDANNRDSGRLQSEKLFPHLHTVFWAAMSLNGIDCIQLIPHTAKHAINSVSIPFDDFWLTKQLIRQQPSNSLILEHFDFCTLSYLMNFTNRFQ